MYEFFWVARRGSTEGLRLWHFLLISGILSASSASASASAVTATTATASTHLERNELRARPDHSRHGITYSQARKETKKRKKNHDLDNQRIPIPRPAIPMASNHHHNPHLHHIHASRRLPPLLDPKKNSPQRGLAHVRHHAV